MQLSKDDKSRGPFEPVILPNVGDFPRREASGGSPSSASLRSCVSTFGLAEAASVTFETQQGLSGAKPALTTHVAPPDGMGAVCAFSGICGGGRHPGYYGDPCMGRIRDGLSRPRLASEKTVVSSEYCDGNVVQEVFVAACDRDGGLANRRSRRQDDGMPLSPQPASSRASAVPPKSS